MPPPRRGRHSIVAAEATLKSVSGQLTKRWEAQFPSPWQAETLAEFAARKQRMKVEYSDVIKKGWQWRHMQEDETPEHYTKRHEDAADVSIRMHVLSAVSTK